MMPPKAPKVPPYGPAPWDEADAFAIKALIAGNANDAQQRRAIDWIINRACQTYDEPFIPDNPRATDYLLGRRSVGLQIVKLANVSLGALKKKESHG